MRNKIKLISLLSAAPVLFGTLVHAVNPEDIGIYIDKTEKVITIDGSKNDNKTDLDGDLVTELSAYNVDQCGFNWFAYQNNGYRVIINNVNIHLSGTSLSWFINSGIDVVLGSKSYISGEGFVDFANGLLDRSEQRGNIRFECGLPDSSGNMRNLNKYYIAHTILLKKDYGYIFE